MQEEVQRDNKSWKDSLQELDFHTQNDSFLENLSILCSENHFSNQSNNAGAGAEGTLSNGFENCNVVVLEAVSGKNISRGTGTLVRKPEDWNSNIKENDEYEYEWLLTAAHCVSYLKAKEVIYHEKIRVRIPILEKWKDPTINERVGDASTLFTDYILPIVGDKNVFIFDKYKRGSTSEGTDFALIKIPPLKYRAGISHASIFRDKPPEICTVVGFPQFSDNPYLYKPQFSTGTGECVEQIVQSDTGLRVASYTLDTLPGQSGGAVCFDNVIVGCHMRACGIQTNEGALLTWPIKEWIEETFSWVEDDKECFAYTNNGNSTWSLPDGDEDSWTASEENVQGMDETAEEAIQARQASAYEVIRKHTSIYLGDETIEETKKNELVDIVVDITEQMKSSERVLQDNPVLNEDLVNRIVGLKADLKEAFQELYRVDPDICADISQSDPTLMEYFNEFCKNTTYSAVTDAKTASPLRYELWDEDQAAIHKQAQEQRLLERTKTATERLMKVNLGALAGEDDFGAVDIGGLDEEPEMITLTSSGDNPRSFEIQKQYALMSKLVFNVLEGDSDALAIKILQVDGSTLELIVEYLNHHKSRVPAEIAKPIRSVKMEKIVEDLWDAEYINRLDKRSLFKIILGANYMDIKSLLHLGCAKVAIMIKGKSPEEIKKILGEE